MVIAIIKDSEVLHVQKATADRLEADGLIHRAPAAGGFALGLIYNPSEGVSLDDLRKQTDV